MSENYGRTNLSHDGQGSYDFFSEADLEPTRMRWENDQVCGVTESWSSARDNSVTSGRDVDRVRGVFIGVSC